MFLPFEGLYAEVVRRGLLETLQRDYKVNIAGPTTMAALLNSLQMGFKTLAIQKHSSEVWNVLGAVKTEFDKFGDVLAATQNKINQANAELDKLIGVRTRSIIRKLKNVTQLPERESSEMLGIEMPEADMSGASGGRASYSSSVQYGSSGSLGAQGAYGSDARHACTATASASSTKRRTWWSRTWAGASPSPRTNRDVSSTSTTRSTATVRRSLAEK